MCHVAPSQSDTTCATFCCRARPVGTCLQRNNSFIYAQKSPMFTQKSPIFTHTSPTEQGLLAHASKEKKGGESGYMDMRTSCRSARLCCHMALKGEGIVFVSNSAECNFFYRALLQKIPTILRSQLIGIAKKCLYPIQYFHIWHGWLRLVGSLKIVRLFCKRAL